MSAAPALGVNRTNLIWVRDWRATLDAMAGAGVRRARFSMNSPYSQTVATVVEANQRGIAILMNIPLGYGEFYTPDAPVRAQSGKFFAQRRLSDISIERFEQSLATFFVLLEATEGRIEALQVGNEINWSAFNADMPLNDPGQIVGLQLFETMTEAPRIEEG